jgi:hypothetical protein
MAYIRGHSEVAIDAVEEGVMAALNEYGPSRTLWRAFMSDPSWAFESALRSEAMLMLLPRFCLRWCLYRCRIVFC